MGGRFPHRDFFPGRGKGKARLLAENEMARDVQQPPSSDSFVGEF